MSSDRVSPTGVSDRKCRRFPNKWREDAGGCPIVANCGKPLDGKLALSRRSHDAGEAKLDQLGTILPGIETKGETMKAKPKVTLTPGQKAAMTRKRRAAGRKAATTRKRREAARKAAVTRAKNKR